MEEKVMSVEEIDAHLQKSQSSTRDIGTATSTICKVFNDVRPILLFAKNLLFFKPKWKEVLQTLINAMDENCKLDQKEG